MKNILKNIKSLIKKLFQREKEDENENMISGTEAVNTGTEKEKKDETDEVFEKIKIREGVGQSSALRPHAIPVKKGHGIKSRKSHKKEEPK